MSVQVAKSTGNTTPTPGRRTPLSLSGTVGKSSKVQQADPDKNASTPGVSLKTSSTANPISKTATKNDKNESSTTDLKKISEKSDKKNANTKNQTTENVNNSAKDKSSDDKKKDDKKKDDKKKDDKKKDDKKKDIDSVKKDDKKQENGLNEGKDSSKANGIKNDEKIGEKSEEKNEESAGGHKESSKQNELTEKSGQEQKVKETKESNKTSGVKKLEVNKSSKNEDNDSKQEKKKIVEDVTEKSIDKDEKKNESDETAKKSRKQPETPKKDEKKSREIDSVTPVKQADNKQPISNQSITSLALEKDLKGSVPEGDEMESLLFDSESDTNGGPSETSTPGRILKMKTDLHHSIQKTAYERRENYEMYEPRSVKDDKREVTSATASPLERPQFTSSYRTISGRRSLRPAKDYSFQGTYRETYRKINTELDYTTSSMNATVGSEIPNESSFSLFGRGKKRDRTPPVTSTNDIPFDNQMEVELCPKSPKRAKLDFSGIMGFVASPVTLLRAKLSRAKLQSSTPNGKVSSTTKDDEDGVENVSVIATEEMAASDIADACEDENVKNTEPSEKDVNDEYQEELDMDIVENVEPQDIQKLQVVTESMENVNKRRMCNVM